MEKLRKENEQLKRLREEERLQWEGKWSQEEMEIVDEETETRIVKEITDAGDRNYMVRTNTHTWR